MVFGMNAKTYRIVRIQHEYCQVGVWVGFCLSFLAVFGDRRPFLLVLFVFFDSRKLFIYRDLGLLTNNMRILTN